MPTTKIKRKKTKIVHNIYNNWGSRNKKLNIEWVGMRFSQKRWKTRNSEKAHRYSSKRVKFINESKTPVPKKLKKKKPLKVKKEDEVLKKDNKSQSEET